MPANSPAKPSQANTADKRDVIPGILRFLAQQDGCFGYASALLKYGRHFKPVEQLPEELSLGPMGECYANCARALSPFLAYDDKPYYYAEGYALDSELGIPYDHAWLVDMDGNAIDLTWRETTNAVYFGVTFKDTFVYDAMRETRLFGILVNIGLYRRLYTRAEGFAATLAKLPLPGLPRGKIT